MAPNSQCSEMRQPWKDCTFLSSNEPSQQSPPWAWELGVTTLGWRSALPFAFATFKAQLLDDGVSAQQFSGAALLAHQEWLHHLPTVTCSCFIPDPLPFQAWHFKWLSASCSVHSDLSHSQNETLKFGQVWLN